MSPTPSICAFRHPQCLPARMNCAWTPNAGRPKRLYRVVNPNSACKFNEKEGFIAADTSTVYNFSSNGKDRSDWSAFYASIQSHRDVERIRSPYISVFADQTEAESWTLAAEEIFGKGCYLAEIDLTHEKMTERPVWFVQDIQKRSQYSTFRNSAKARDANPNLPPRGISLTPRNSEFLVLYKIPIESVISKITPEQIREKRKSPPHTPLLPIADKDSIARTCGSLGEYWLLPSPYSFAAECHCIDEPCTCKMEKQVPEFTVADLRNTFIKNGPFPGQAVDTNPFIRPVLFNPFAEDDC